jgi:hypothetical protein
MFGFLENFFFISLGITFGLILLLIYHFKERMTAVERKGETVYELLTNIVKEINILKSGCQAHEHFIRSTILSGVFQRPSEFPDEPLREQIGDNISVYVLDNSASPVVVSSTELDVSKNAVENPVVVSDSDSDSGSDSDSDTEYAEDTESDDDDTSVSDIDDDIYQPVVLEDSRAPDETNIDILEMVESVVELVVEPVAEPVVEPVAEPVVEPIAEPVEIESFEPVSEPAVEPEPAAIIEQTVESSVEASVQVDDGASVQVDDGASVQVDAGASVQVDDDNVSVISSAANATQKRAYNKMSLSQLRALATSASTIDVSNMRKQELVQFMKSLDDESAK